MNAELSLAELKKSLSNAEFATDYSRIYDDFVRSLMGCGDNQVVKHPQEYHGQEVIKLVCSQYENIFEYLSSDDPKEYERRQHRYTVEWVRFLQNETLPVKKIHVCSSVNQKVFDALCKRIGTWKKTMSTSRLLCSLNRMPLGSLTDLNVE